MGAENNASLCAKQNSLLKDQMMKNPHWMDPFIPNLIFAPEIVASFEKSPSLVSIDDEVLHEYISWFYMIKYLVNFVEKGVQKNPIPELNYYEKTTKNFYGRLFFNLDKTFPDIARQILVRDALEPYMRQLKDDFETIFYTYEKKPLSGDPIDSGLLFLLKNQRVLQKSVFLERIKETLDAYGEFCKRIADVYFEKKIKSDPKYDIIINNPESPLNGKKYLKIVTPEFLFTKYNYKNHENENFVVASIDWRDHFITLNIIEKMKKFPESNLLVWVGEAHVRGVIKNLVEKKELTPDVDKINIVNLKSNDVTACNFGEVLRTMYEKKGAVNILDWNEKYGDQDYKSVVSVYDLKGNIVYKDNFYYRDIDKIEIEKDIGEKLKADKQTGIFLIKIQSSRLKDIATYKILVSE